MPGAKIPVLEIENLFISHDGRGLILNEDGGNFKAASTSPWTSYSYATSGNSLKSYPGSGGKPLLPTASSLGWLKIHYISSSTYGATGATAYIPIFTNVNINIV